MLPAAGAPSPAFAVETLEFDAVRTELTKVGVQFRNDTPQRNGPTRSYFSRPETTRGVVFQFLDRRV